MGKYLRYDKEGKEVYFNHAVDAREGVQLGHYFETNPKEDEAKEKKMKEDSDAKKESKKIEKESKKVEKESDSEDND